MRRERGAALVLVLGAVALLTIVAVELASRASADALRAARGSRDASFRRLFDSAGELARGLLLERPAKDFDFWGDAWNRDYRIVLGSDETAVLHVADESGKIHVARIWEKPQEKGVVLTRVTRLFEYLKRREPARAKPLKEAEAKVLARLNSPVRLETLDGFRETGLSLDDLFGPSGLARYLTCYGDGRLNLNTAPPAVLVAWDEGFDEAIVDRIAAFRGRGEGAPGTYRAFEDPKDLMLVDGIVTRAFVDGRFTIVRNLFEQVGGSLSVASSAFSVHVKAEVGARRRDAWIILEPDGRRRVFEEVLP